MFRKPDRETLVHIGMILAMAGAAMLPSYLYGVPSGNDQLQHYQFAWTVDDAVRNGILYPGHAAGTNHGYGDVGIRFYPPLTYYVLAAGNLILRDWYFASLAAFTLVFFFGGLGIYKWAVDLYDPKTALMAAGLYIFIPYHLNEIYNNFLLAEFFATAIVPWCFLYLSRVCRADHWRDVAALAITVSLLTLTHLPLTILSALVMAVYAIVLIPWRLLHLKILRLSVAALLAVAMSAFYWARWLPELSWVTHSSPRYFSTIWDYRENFLLLPSHFTRFGDDALNLWFADILLFTAVIIVLPTLVLLARGVLDPSRSLWAIGISLTVCILFTTPLTAPVWDSIALLQKVQFPWRWLAIINVLSSVFAAVGIVRGQAAAKGHVLATSGIACILAALVFVAVFTTRGSVYVGRRELNEQVSSVKDTSGCDCWWPIWAERAAFDQTEPVAAGARAINVNKWSLDEREFTIQDGPETIASVRAFYYPRWAATINGKSVPVQIDTAGRLGIQIPAEVSSVRLEFREPQYVRYATILSIFVWGMMLAVMIILAGRRGGIKWNTSSR